MKVRLLSRANSGGSSSRNGNCSSTPGWTYSGGTVPNPVLELGSHRIPNPGSGIQRLLSSCVKHTHLVCHTHTPLFVSESRGFRPSTNTQLAIPNQLQSIQHNHSSHPKWQRWWKCFPTRHPSSSRIQDAFSVALSRIIVVEQSSVAYHLASREYSDLGCLIRVTWEETRTPS